jgi:hypothetical protein
VEVFIKIGSYFTLSNGEPKRYYQRSHLPSFVLGRNKCVLLNSINYIGTKIIWGSKQYKEHPTCYYQNMWATTKCFTIEKYNYHMGNIEEKAMDALAWLDDNHPFVWTRSMV